VLFREHHVNALLGRAVSLERKVLPQDGDQLQAGAILPLELVNDLPGFGPLLSDVARTADENAKPCHEVLLASPLSSVLSSSCEQVNLIH
jgi:hypothetical protein